jgi:hypothetical protein
LVIAKGPGIGVLLQGWHFNAFLLDFGDDGGMTLLRGGLQGLHAPALIDNKKGDGVFGWGDGLRLVLVVVVVCHGDFGLGHKGLSDRSPTPILTTL